ncbi:TetR/AcrR family transcriptional regulator [Leeia aquatica]|uniref:TetR/AcrR family transcriptional regulator n=1 Tax=Leeia aquatica TaxID=2725557 RepID=A0A847SDR7_9NEIS|nr:TetR/AcrR family transcriptional regulator [Leeia aquatica]NLR75439.1 TetR/AcrR family transcriptional regulator [Leeia aquatica]
MGKGEQTKALIIHTARQVASEVGLDSLTIGDLAVRMGMSKSGLFGHFGSREELQREVMAATAQVFAETVVKPALKLPRGLVRLRAMFEGWLDYETSLPGGCLIAAAVFEFDSKPGMVRDAVFEHQRNWQGFLEKAAQLAVETGELPADTAIGELAFMLLGIVYSSYVYRGFEPADQVRRRIMRSFEHLLHHPPRQDKAD